jgi:hypothetical protein
MVVACTGELNGLIDARRPTGKMKAGRASRALGWTGGKRTWEKTGRRAGNAWRGWQALSRWGLGYGITIPYVCVYIYVCVCIYIRQDFLPPVVTTHPRVGAARMKHNWTRVPVLCFEDASSQTDINRRLCRVVPAAACKQEGTGPRTTCPKQTQASSPALRAPFSPARICRRSDTTLQEL